MQHLLIVPVHAAGYTRELLYCEAGKQPDKAMLNFWHTLSDCLTVLEIDASDNAPNLQLQPQLLKQLTALTKLTFHARGGPDVDVLVNSTLHLPQLRTLCLDGYWGRDLVLDCPKLTNLTLGGWGGLEEDVVYLVSLQARLECFRVRWSSYFRMHAGFPVANFLDVVSLSVECRKDDGEEELFAALPLMKKLQTLELKVHQGWLLTDLPQSLCEVALEYTSVAGWDDRVIPALQKLPELQHLKIFLRWNGKDSDTEGSDAEEEPATLSCDLRPFTALQKLCTLQVGPREAWAPSSLRTLGELQAELVMSSSKRHWRF